MGSLTDEMRKYSVTPQLADSNLSLEGLQQMSMARKVDYIKSQLNPVALKMCPPNNNNLNSSIQDITVFGDFAQSAKQQIGAILWLPQRGAISVNRLGYFRQTTAMSHSTHTSGSNPGWWKGTYLKIGGPSSAAPTTGVSMMLTQDLFTFVMPTQDLSLKPPLQKQFSQGRVISGAITVRSATTSGDNVRLQGSLSGAAVSDTRALPGLAPPSLRQQAVTNKDGHLCVPAYEGLVAILGPDIQSEYDPLDTNLTTENMKSAFLYDILQGTQIGVGAKTTNTLADAIWISSTSELGSTLPSELPQQFSVPPVAYDTAPEIVVKVQANPLLTAIETADRYDAATIDGEVQVIHYWYQQQVDGSGNVSLIVTSEPSPGPVSGQSNTNRIPDQSNNQRFLVPLTNLPIQQRSVLPTEAPLTQINGCYTFRAASVRQPNYQWAGSLIIPRGPTITKTSNPDQPGFYVYEVDFIAKNLYAQGNLGVARIIRWDNLESQSVVIQGQVNVEAIATGEVAPYVTQDDYSAFDAGLLPFTAKLFNGPFTEFRRMYTGRQYFDMMRKFFSSISVEQLIEYTRTRKPSLAIEAASIFGTLAKLATELGGGLSKLNNPYARGIGRALMIGGQVAPHLEQAYDKYKEVRGDGFFDGFVDEAKHMAGEAAMDAMIGAEGQFDDAESVSEEEIDVDADARFAGYTTLPKGLGGVDRQRRISFRKGGVAAKNTLDDVNDAGRYVSAATLNRLSKQYKIKPGEVVEMFAPNMSGGKGRKYYQLPSRLRGEKRWSPNFWNRYKDGRMPEEAEGYTYVGKGEKGVRPPRPGQEKWANAKTTQVASFSPPGPLFARSKYHRIPKGMLQEEAGEETEVDEGDMEQHVPLPAKPVNPPKSVKGKNTGKQFSPMAVGAKVSGPGAKKVKTEGYFY